MRFCLIVVTVDLTKSLAHVTRLQQWVILISVMLSLIP